LVIIVLRCLGISLPIFNNYLNSYKLNIHNEYNNFKLLDNKNISLNKKSLLDYNDEINLNTNLNLDKNFDELVK